MRKNMKKRFFLTFIVIVWGVAILYFPEDELTTVYGHQIITTCEL